MKQDPIQQVEALTKELHSHIEKQGEGVFEKYPLTFALLATFGVVLVGHGLSSIIKLIPLLQNTPVVSLVLGIIILLVTGSLYKRLNK